MKCGAITVPHFLVKRKANSDSSKIFLKKFQICSWHIYRDVVLCISEGSACPSCFNTWKRNFPFFIPKNILKIIRRQESKWQDSANNLWIQTDCRSSRCLIAPNLQEWILMWLNAPLVAAPSYHGPSGSMIMNGIGEHKRIWCKKQHSFFCGSLNNKKGSHFCWEEYRSFV